jgi:hypothetical protein
MRMEGGGFTYLFSARQSAASEQNCTIFTGNAFWRTLEAEGRTMPNLDQLIQM